MAVAMLRLATASLAWLGSATALHFTGDDAHFVAQFHHPRVTVRENVRSRANFTDKPAPLPLHRVPNRRGRKLQRVPKVPIPWSEGATTFDWRDVVRLPPVHHQNHNECYAETAGITLTALWDMLYEDSSDTFDPDELVKCAHETPGVPALPSDILQLSQVLEPITGCHPQRGQQGMLLEAEPVELCDLAGDWDIENRLMGMLAMGPVSVGIESTNPVFRLYAGGVLSPDQVETKKGVVDHAVSLVGFGEEEGKPYWVIRNSWGKDWGEDGYARVARKDDNTGVLNSYAAVTRAVKT